MVGGDSIYILKRKIKAFFYGLPFLFCRLFPIQKNKIVVWTFEGTGGYGCSPRYIAQELLKRNKEQGTKFEIYWLLTDLNKSFPSEIKKIKDTTWNRAYHMTTAAYWIGNSRTFYGTRKRKGTTYIQTWHGSLSLKPIGKYRGDSFSKMAYLVSKADSDLIDILTSGSKYCTDMWVDGLIFDRKIDETGTPRCDVLINNVEEKHRQFREEYGLPMDCKIAIYAPTFRGGSQGTVRAINENPITIDFDRVIKALEKRFGGTWYMFLRLHPQLSVFTEKMKVDGNSERLIDVTQRPDMNEIMAATDAIITDYSTCIFEGFLTGQPGFIYADDLDDYIKERGKLMFGLDEIPFEVASDNDGLERNILEFDGQKYREKSELFIEQNGLFRDGQAAKRVADFIN